MRHRMALFIAASIAFAASAPIASAASDRVALVIGNGGYLNANKLVNPPNDATDIAAALRKLGFDVVEGLDLEKRGMEAKASNSAANSTMPEWRYSFMPVTACRSPGATI